MATHGAFGEFESSKEDWTSYTERLEHYFEANDVNSAEKQRAILLSGCGALTYQLIDLRDLVAPAKPTTNTVVLKLYSNISSRTSTLSVLFNTPFLTVKSFNELVKLVKDHHQHPPSYERRLEWFLYYV